MVIVVNDDDDDDDDKERKGIKETECPEIYISRIFQCNFHFFRKYGSMKKKKNSFSSSSPSNFCLVVKDFFCSKTCC